MSKNSFTRRQFLRTAAVAAAPAVLPASLFGRDKRGGVVPARDRYRKVDEFWAGYFGCSTQDLHGTKTVVVPHRALVHWDGAFLFRHAGSCIVSVPPSVTEKERSKLRAAKPSELGDPGILAGILGVEVEKVRVPATLGIADRGDFKPVASSARLLGAEDEMEIEKLAAGCHELARVPVRLLTLYTRLFGLFEGGELVSASTHRVLGNGIAYVGAITHPKHRGKGYGKAIASASVKDALEKGLLPMWRSTASSEPGTAIGRSLGFQAYASTVVVDLVEYNF